MNYFVNVTESNFSEVWNAAAQVPVVFNFISPREVASLEMDSLLRRLADENPAQFLLATVNCDEQQALAAQFRIQTIPTMYLFAGGQPVDMIQGAISEQEMRVRLANILPKEEELKFNQALELLQDQCYEEALPLLKSAWEMTDKKNSDFALLYAETFIVMKKVEEAREILKQIPIQDRDSRWNGLQAQIELLEQANESPELQQLQADYANNKTPEIAIRLANQLHQAHKNEEALALLFDWLKADLNSANGEVKSQFLAILSALGNDPVVPKFRRQLYSLLY
ncbi:possible thioredoxin-like protein [Actinobacillus pleuropneumoniae serovar 3 str. JL03]|uniref:Possible thioredoxin-like protein n=1 Tax=Actinobacillus pleuropneumoniae serotype 3 (strain JL03) TaxID=434271 RepID=B0BRY6_ACTPJ|nr:co-chaperone YbbN [Actinobacillus pleuropneumoniae]ABY68686.1 possible thioredoxin-like protein [Actinobacillus pleuropneumoniae serovar 3 str. JL03]UKH13672.1 co-chaperone YbbN [Actinobacillus pleuropneumoniae]UKH42863.1 co-chaperone YbbN [Actinobacillus pleuropneumoniae]